MRVSSYWYLKTFCHERLDAMLQALSFLDPNVQALLALPPSSSDVLWIIETLACKRSPQQATSSSLRRGYPLSFAYSRARLLFSLLHFHKHSLFQ